MQDDMKEKYEKFWALEDPPKADARVRLRRYDWVTDLPIIIALAVSASIIILLS